MGDAAFGMVGMDLETAARCRTGDPMRLISGVIDKLDFMHRLLKDARSAAPVQPAPAEAAAPTN